MGQWGAIQTAAPSFAVDVSPINMRDATDIERGIAAFARSPNGGLILTGSGLAVVHRHLIITLAARHKLPAVYPRRVFVTDGGLISYGPDEIEQHRRAAGYVDRILTRQERAVLTAWPRRGRGGTPDIGSTDRCPDHAPNCFQELSALPPKAGLNASSPHVA